MSKVSLYKLPHVDVSRMTADAPLSIQLQKGKGFLVSEKSGVKTTFTVTEEDLENVTMVLRCSDSVRNLAMHLMSYHGHDMERVVDFLNNVNQDQVKQIFSKE